MLRLRCSISPSLIKFQREALISRRGYFTFRPVGYSLSVSTQFLLLNSQTPFVSTLATQRRWVRARGNQEGNTTDENNNSQKQEEEKSDNKEKGENNKNEKKSKSSTSGGFKAHIQGLKDDYIRFPDIYNSANALNFILFTVFCLCSTGSNVEEKWWLENWGIDASFAPLAWGLHSLLMNNFLSMTYAMMLLHTMCHSVLPTIGSRGLMIYCIATAVTSGFIMFVGNYLLNNTSEKQFGPWDIVAALFVMQYLHQGFTPIQILNSFNGWVRYACWVGAICILYFDWQPTVVGTLVGIALCKGHPKFRVAGPVS